MSRANERSDTKQFAVARWCVSLARSAGLPKLKPITTITPSLSMCGGSAVAITRYTTARKCAGGRRLTKNIRVRLSPEQLEKLQVIAEREDRSVGHCPQGYQ